MKEISEVSTFIKTQYNEDKKQIMQKLNEKIRFTDFDERL